MYSIRPISRRGPVLFRSFSPKSSLHNPIPTRRPNIRASIPSIRWHSTNTSSDGLRNNRDLSQSQISSSDASLLSKLSSPPKGREEVPSYAMVFTCKKCSERSAHKISKQAYHHGTVLITCPGCENRHLMADHLKIFSDESVTLENILAEKGNKLKKAFVNVNGDVEFLPDEKVDTAG